MKKKLRAAACGIAVACLSAGAHAVPITFDFSGTVTGTTLSAQSLSGAAASGRISFETDGLVQTVSESPVHILRYGHDTVAPAPNLFSGGVTAGGSAFPLAAQYNYNRVDFFDGCTPGCPPFIGESFSLLMVARDIPFGGVPTDGTYHHYDLMFLASQPNDPVTGERMDYFDSTAPGFDVMSVLSLPLYAMTGIYSDYTYDCVAGACTTSVFQFQFSVSDITRGVTGVPEPAALGLLGAGLFGMLMRRRRKA